MTEVKRYESLRNGEIGTVVSEDSTQTILDFEGTQKTVKKSNLNRWYKPYTGDGEQLEEDKKLAEKNKQLIQRVDNPNKPNGDTPPKEDCSKLANKIITYLEKNECLTKKTCSYTRVRYGTINRNIMEMAWGKRLTGIKLTVKSEALLPNKKLYDLGKTVPPTHMYTLDHVMKFNNSSNIEDIYAVIDAIILYEKNYKPEPRKKAPNGKGKVNGKTSLASKRKALGVKTDSEINEEKCKEVES